MKIIFLDIDGVLNNHVVHKYSECGIIDKKCMTALNHILVQTGAKIVVSSAWRYMRKNNHMSDTGFEHMMRSHGLKKDSIIGFTEYDEFCKKCASKVFKTPFGVKFEFCKNCDMIRARQVVRWILDNAKNSKIKYVIVDDLDLGFTKLKLPFYQTNKDTGLTLKDIRPIINMFGV